MKDSIKYCSNPICSKEIKGFGNNPQPFLNLNITDSVCDSCNEIFVIPSSIMKKSKNRKFGVVGPRLKETGTAKFRVF